MVVMQECGLLQGNPFSCGESQLLGSLLHSMWHGEGNDGAYTFKSIVINLLYLLFIAQSAQSYS